MMNKSFLPPRRKGIIRILAFSDWRVQDYNDLLQFIKQIPTCDLVVYAGDDLDRLIASQDAVRQAVEMTTAGRLLFVAGNDDVPEDRELLGELLFCHDLHKSPYEFENFIFLGQEGTTDGMGFIQHSERQVKEHLDEHLAARRQKGRKVPGEWKSAKATQVKSRLTADLTGWEADNQKFEGQFERLVKALRTDEGRESPPTRGLTL